MDAKIEIAQVSNQALTNSVVGDVMMYATSNVQNVLIGQSNSLPAIKCTGANVTTGANLTVTGNINVLGSILQSGSTVNTNVPTGYAIITDTKTTGTAGQTMTGGQWNQRNLTTVNANVNSNVSLVSNQVWINAGTYYTKFLCTTLIYTTTGQPWTSCRLRNMTTSADVCYSSKLYSGGALNMMIPLLGEAVFTVSSGSNLFEIDQWASTTGVSAGTGNSSGSVPDIYAQWFIQRIG